MLINSKVLANIISAKVQRDFFISSFSIDSRSLKNNDCFIALIGNNHNGHNYIKDAIKNGASAIIINEDYEALAKEQLSNFKNYLVVKDTYKALIEIAKYTRSIFEKPIVGITGSVGKTTLKEMIAFVFSYNHKVGMTLKNLNNHIGLPLCLSNLQNDDNIGVFEMGMNRSGEIKFLGEVLKPDIGIITSIGNAHAEFFKATKDIALAKLEILDNLCFEGAFFINLDDEYVDLFYEKASEKNITNIITFSISNTNADVYIKDYKMEFKNADSYGCVVKALIFDYEIDFFIKSLAIHNVIFACVALSIASLCGLNMLELSKCLKDFDIPQGRGKISTLKIDKNKVITLIDDAYNASPKSIKSAIENFNLVKGSKILLLGEMLELGESSIQEHISLEKAILQQKFKRVILVGKNMKPLCEKLPKNNTKYFENIDIAQFYLLQILANEDILLAKGSFGSGVHKIVNNIIQTSN